MHTIQKTISALLIFTLPIPMLYAKDTEIFYTADDKERRALVLFDTSGSMNDKNASTKIKKIITAKEAFQGIIDDNPKIRFGLEIFDQKASQGGHIVYAMPDTMTPSDQKALKDTVTNINAKSGTPLSESLYEAYLYLGGHPPKYGTQSVPESKNGDNYKSPLTKVADKCEMNTVIIMTDGIPSVDWDADDLIKDLTGEKCSGNCLDEIAGWMYDHDIMNGGYGQLLSDPPGSAQHNIVTHTIGFEIKSDLLQRTAQKGHGNYYPEVSGSKELRAAFQQSLVDIIETNATMAPPAIPIDLKRPTLSAKEIYIPIFRPAPGPSWNGNLKKLLIDADGTISGVDTTTGAIKKTFTTEWSNVVDGDQVTKGGAGAEINIGSRIVYSNFRETDDNNGGPKLNQASHRDYFGKNFNKDTVKEILHWLQGYKRGTDTHRWPMGDVNHSAPVVVNYGGDPQKKRVIFGTNDGLLHNIDSANGAEKWVFYPKSMARHFDYVSTLTNTYKAGIDGSPTVYLYNKNAGESGDYDYLDSGDEVWVFFGLRRGGKDYYGLDISNRDLPVFKWTINSSISDFKELGQTWSKPVLGQISLNPAPDKPTLFFAGGYDTNKDTDELGDDDTEGRAIYLINAKLGALGLIQSFTPAATNISKKNTYAAIKDSIPAEIATADSNGDGVIDRFYVGDTGGNIWRADLFNDDWSIFKLASLGSDSDRAHDRRFFNRIDVVSTTKNGVAYDAVLVGTGNRASPNKSITKDHFYMIKDLYTVPTYFTDAAGLSKAPCTTGIYCEKIPATILLTNLTEVTANKIMEGTPSEKVAKEAALYHADNRGWYIDLDAGDGETVNPAEKNLGPAITLEGTVYFTTYMPPTPKQISDGREICTGAIGDSYLWAVNLHDGTPIYGDTASDRKKLSNIASLVGGQTPFFGEQGKVSPLTPNKRESQSSIYTGSMYWYQEHKK